MFEIAEWHTMCYESSHGTTHNMLKKRTEKKPYKELAHS